MRRFLCALLIAVALMVPVAVRAGQISIIDGTARYSVMVPSEWSGKLESLRTFLLTENAKNPAVKAIGADRWCRIAFTPTVVPDKRKRDRALYQWHEHLRTISDSKRDNTLGLVLRGPNVIVYVDCITSYMDDTATKQAARKTFEAIVRSISVPY